MISRRYGVRLVRHGPASEAPRELSTRCLSAQAETVSIRVRGETIAPGAKQVLAAVEAQLDLWTAFHKSVT